MSYVKKMMKEKKNTTHEHWEKSHNIQAAWSEIKLIAEILNNDYKSLKTRDLQCLSLALKKSIHILEESNLDSAANSFDC